MLQIMRQNWEGTKQFEVIKLRKMSNLTTAIVGMNTSFQDNMNTLIKYVSLLELQFTVVSGGKYERNCRWLSAV